MDGCLTNGSLERSVMSAYRTLCEGSLEEVDQQIAAAQTAAEDAQSRVEALEDLRRLMIQFRGGKKSQRRGSADTAKPRPARDRIYDFLSDNAPCRLREVANAVGCDKGYISTLLSTDPRFTRGPNGWQLASREFSGV